MSTLADDMAADGVANYRAVLADAPTITDQPLTAADAASLSTTPPRTFDGDVPVVTIGAESGNNWTTIFLALAVLFLVTKL